MSIKIKGNSEIECKVDIQKEVFWSTKIEDSGNYRYIERNPNIAIFQILNGYMNRIAFLNLVSNRMPEKCGFEAIKEANL